MERVCYNCFLPCDSNICLNCGYKQGSSKEKYTLALSEGCVLGGKYIVGRVLGQGGFGTTYVAQDFETKQLVAIKEYFPDSLVTRTGKLTVSTISSDRAEDFNYGKDCFLREAKTLAQFIGHPNIVRVYSFFEENNTAYFAMEYLKGESFLDYLRKKGKISWEETRKIIDPVMDALEFVHSKGVVHRDISPDNIYLCEDGTIKLIDFGAARYSLGDHSHSLSVVLKHGFAPKEQYSRRGRQGPFTDIYALAATMYRAVTGRVPENSIDRMESDELAMPNALGVDVPVQDEMALEKALSVLSTERYQTIAEFRNALVNLKEQEEMARREAEEKAKREAEEKARREAEEKARREAEEKAKREAEEKAKREAEEKAKREAEEKAKHESEAKRKSEEKTRIATKHQEQKIKSTHKTEKTKGKKKFVLLGFIAAVIVAGVVVAVNMFSSSGSDKIKVPDVVGLTESAAISEIENAGLSYSVETEYSDSVKDGYVISQSVDGDSEVAKTESVDLVISKGTELLDVPNEVGKKVNTALEELQDAGFSVAVSEKYSSSVDKNNVISQEPDSGKFVKGSEIKLTVSKGEKLYKVPNVKGLSESTATTKLENANLIVEVKSEYSNSVEEGKVIKQSVKAGKKVKKNTMVTITVSMGRKPETTQSTDTTTSDDYSYEDSYSDYTYDTPNINENSNDEYDELTF